MTPRKRSQPANLAIAERIGVGIVTGDFSPGAVLPGEIELAAQHGVSRSVIREALRMLAAKGLLESRPKAGTKVRDRSAWNLLDPDLLKWMFEGEPPASFVHALFELRLIVEPAAAALAAANRTARQLSQMRAALHTMAEQGLGEEAGRAADQQFHSILLAATDNELLVTLSSSIAAAVRWTTFYKHKAGRPMRDAIPLHGALYDAIAAADPAAARAAAATLIEQAEVDTAGALGARP